MATQEDVSKIRLEMKMFLAKRGSETWALHRVRKYRGFVMLSGERVSEANSFGVEASLPNRHCRNQASFTLRDDNRVLELVH